MTLEQFEDTTGLLPGLIADAVARELAELLKKEQPADLADYLTARTLAIATANRRFFKRLKAASGRDVLYAYARHWASAELARRFGRAYLAPLPAGYTVGRY